MRLLGLILVAPLAAALGVDCKISHWSNWSACSKTCGPGGNRTKTRSIVRHDAYGGARCAGHALKKTAGCQKPFAKCPAVKQTAKPTSTPTPSPTMDKWGNDLVRVGSGQSRICGGVVEIDYASMHLTHINLNDYLDKAKPKRWGVYRPKYRYQAANALYIDPATKKLCYRDAGGAKHALY